MCVRVSTRVRACVCMNNEIAPFSRFLLSPFFHTSDILVQFLSFFSCEITFFFFFCASDVAKRGVCESHNKS